MNSDDCKHPVEHRYTSVAGTVNCRLCFRVLVDAPLTTVRTQKMNHWQRLVYNFHKMTGGTIGETIAIRDRELRAKLIMEEAVETVSALGYVAMAQIEDPLRSDEMNPQDAYIVATFHKVFHEPNLEEFVDGMCDLIYVVAGSAVAAGVDLSDHFDEVHRANMQKLDGPKRADGKQLKPEGWTKPDHQSLFDRDNAINERMRAKPGWH